MQRKRRRTQESSKKVEVGVPVKRPRRAGLKYTAPIKAGSNIKVAPTKTKRRQAVVKVADVDSTLFIDHLVVDMGCLRDQALERVGELLENQG